ncbi:MAG: glycosyltransferase [Chlorobi bacterium]|nr:glycosyltransferase [Chlorobiota bacterium]
MSIIPYLWVLLLLWLWLRKEPPLTRSERDDCRFTLIVPFRNEAARLPYLLKALSALDYPAERVEIIFADDHSEDKSIRLIEQASLPFRTSILKLPPAERGKKAALTRAVAEAAFPYIITLDADISFRPGYLRSICTALHQRPDTVMGAGPVLIDFSRISGLSGQLQYGEFLALQALTAAGYAAGFPFLANGANLVFRKDVFEKVGGYEGYENLAGGDDMVLLTKLKRAAPGKQAYLKSSGAAVFTLPVENFKAWLNQRVRWAAKMDALPFSPGFVIAGLQLSAFVEALLYMAGIFPGLRMWGWVATGLMLAGHYVLLRQTAKDLGVPFSVRLFWIVQLLLPPAYALVVARILRQKIKGKPLEWKGRFYQK